MLRWAHDGESTLFRTDEAWLAKTQRQLTRAIARSKANGSRDRNRTEQTTHYTPAVNKRRKAVRKVHKRIAHRRETFVQQETRKIVDGYGAIYVERLNMDGMLKTHRLAKSIADAAWGMFLEILAYKAAEAGRRFKRVPPEGTT